MRFKAMSQDGKDIVTGGSLIQLARLSGEPWVYITPSGCELEAVADGVDGSLIRIPSGHFVRVDPSTLEVIDLPGPERQYTRTDYLDRADEVINGERQNQYGEPEDNFGVIADFWSAYFGHKIDVTRADVANLMALMKIARLSSGTAKRDSYVDAIGYMAIGGEISERS